MSYKDFVDIQVKLDKKQFSIGEPIIGELFIKNNSPIQLNLDTIDIKLILKHQGKGETDTIVLDNHIIREYNSLSRNETISSKFEFKPIYNVTYNGHNVTQSILINTKVDINKESEKLLRDEKLSNFKIGGFLRGVFKPDFYNDTPIIIVKGEANYQISKAKGSIKPGLKFAITAFIISAIICVILSFIAHSYAMNVEFFYGIIALFLLAFGVIYYLKLSPYLSIGKIDFELKNLEGNLYEVHLTTEKRTNIIKEISHQIIAKELVTYDNGSSRSTARHTLYGSPANIIKGRAKKLIDEANFPTKSLPITILNNDFEIRWLFTLKIITKTNLKLKGESKINISYENKQ